MYKFSVKAEQSFLKETEELIQSWLDNGCELEECTPRLLMNMVGVLGQPYQDFNDGLLELDSSSKESLAKSFTNLVQAMYEVAPSARAGAE